MNVAYDFFKDFDSGWVRVFRQRHGKVLEEEYQKVFDDVDKENVDE